MSNMISYSNILKTMSVVALIGSSYSVADTSAAEIANSNTLADFAVPVKTTDKLVKTTGAASYLTTVGNTAAVSDVLPAPRTEMGRKLLERRRKALASGMELLTADEINAIVNNGRGSSS